MTSMKSLKKGIRKRFALRSKSKKIQREQRPIPAVFMNEDISFYTERNCGYNSDSVNLSPSLQAEVNTDGLSKERGEYIQKLMLDSFFSTATENNIKLPVKSLQVYSLVNTNLDHGVEVHEGHASISNASIASSVSQDEVECNFNRQSRLQKRATGNEHHDSFQTSQGHYSLYSKSDKENSASPSFKSNNGEDCNYCSPSIIDSLKTGREIYNLYVKLQKNPPPPGYRHEEIDVSRMNDKQYFRHVFMLD